MAQPTVTFVIPCFNHGAFVEEAVRSALAQENASVSVVVVDDGSTDGVTPAACDRCAGDRVTVLHQPNAGPGAARNRGAELATGEFLVFLDGDDTVEPGFVSALAGRIWSELTAGDDDISHAYCQERLTELGTGTWRVPEWDPLLLMITNLHPVTCLVRRRCFEAAGGFDPSLRADYEDWDLWLRFAQRGWRGVRVREPLFNWRRHSHETMVMQAVRRHDEIYSRLVDRHRAMYEQHARELLIRANSMLRRFDCNWLDETGFPIPLQYLWRVRDSAGAAEARAAAAETSLAEVVARLAQASALQEDFARRLADAQAAAASERTRREDLEHFYEGLKAVRMHRALAPRIASLPGPLARTAQVLTSWLTSLLAPRAGHTPVGTPNETQPQGPGDPPDVGRGTTRPDT